MKNNMERNLYFDKSEAQQLREICGAIDLKLQFIGKQATERLKRQYPAEFQEYKNSLPAAKYILSIVKNIWSEQVTRENALEDKQNTYKSIDNALFETIFKVDKALLNQKEFDNIDVVVEKINAAGLSVGHILTQLSRRHYLRGIKWFIENYAMKTDKSVGYSIGVYLIESGIIKEYKNKELTAINALAKAALELIRED